MKNKAFTLIELLVVILIIGILAAIAYSQYQFIINKIRYVNAASIVNTFARAQEMYYLANGAYANSPEKLDITYEISYLPDGSNEFYVNGDTHIKFYVTQISASMYIIKSPSEYWAAYLYYYSHSGNARSCQAIDPWKKVCKKLGGRHRYTTKEGLTEYYITHL